MKKPPEGGGWVRLGANGYRGAAMRRTKRRRPALEAFIRERALYSDEAKIAAIEEQERRRARRRRTFWFALFCLTVLAYWYVTISSYLKFKGF